MTTILLAGYRHEDDPAATPGLQYDSNGKLRLDRRIEQLRALGHEIVSVLSGDAADELVRRSRELPAVDLAFDTHGREVNLVTNLRAGLAAVGERPCLCLPLEVPWPSAGAWSALTAAAREDLGSASLVQIRHTLQPERDFGFPLLVTRHGAREIPRLDGLDSLTDARLEYSFLNL